MRLRFKLGSPVAKFRSLFGHCELRVYLTDHMYVDLGRFSYFAVDKFSLVNSNGFVGCAAQLGDFCELAECDVLIGGEHQVNDGVSYVFTACQPYQCLLQSVGVKTDHLPKGFLSMGHGVIVGHRATVLSGLSIGSGSVIGAAAVVTKNVGPFEVHAGNPCRKLKNVEADQSYQEKYWDSTLSSIYETHKSHKDHLDGAFIRGRRVVIKVREANDNSPKSHKQIEFVGLLVDDTIKKPKAGSPFYQYLEQTKYELGEELEWIEDPLSLAFE